MSQKHAITVFALPLLLILSAVGGALWWFTNRSDFDKETLANNRSQPSSSSSVKSFAQVKFYTYFWSQNTGLCIAVGTYQLMKTVFFNADLTASFYQDVVTS